MTFPYNRAVHGVLAVLPFVAASVVSGSAAPAAAAPGQVLALDVVGPAMNPGKARRCEDVARRHGFMLAPQAPIRVTLQLDRGFNRLTVMSARRGQIIDAPRPGWGMEQLCEDAMQVAERAFANEGQPPAMPATPPPSAYVPPPPAYAPPPSYAPAPSGPPTIALDVTGPFANPGKHERCLRVAQKRGFVVNPAAPLRVLLILQPGMNRLQINSARRGEVLNQPKPGWGMEQLCEDAISQAAVVLSQESVAPPPPSRVPPPPPAGRQRGYALGPIPPSAELSPPAKAAAEAAVAAWQAAQFEQALAAFREAARVQPDPQFFFDQAVCEQRLGRYAEALSHTQLFIDRAPQSPYRPYADQLFGELQAALGGE